jgi:sporulation protein YlmC with PRC-barrel domain
VPSDHEQKPSHSSTNENTSLTKVERKRLKKMRKDKNRQLQSSPDHAQDSFATAAFERKHKKKHKCQDELCKHRKHKKRRKHKKHHHRELEEEDRELQNHVQNAMSISNDSNNNEEEFDEDSNESVTQYEIVKKVGQDMVIKDDPDTMESSVTESSGSLYVS